MALKWALSTPYLTLPNLLLGQCLREILPLPFPVASTTTTIPVDPGLTLQTPPSSSQMQYITPRPAPSDNGAADLMLFLATSPSPARSNKNTRDMAAYRALTGGSGPLRSKGRDLFPSPSATDRPSGHEDVSAATVGITSYIRDWLFSAVPPQSPPTIELISPPLLMMTEKKQKRNGTMTMTMTLRLHFLLSIAPRDYILLRILTDSQLMPPPPVGISISSSPSTLVVPPITTKAPVRNSKKRKKVALAPGYSPLDWVASKASGRDLRVSKTG